MNPAEVWALVERQANGERVLRGVTGSKIPGIVGRWAGRLRCGDPERVKLEFFEKYGESPVESRS